MTVAIPQQPNALDPIGLSFTDKDGKNVTLQLAPGKALYLVGPNGSGKSQLLHHFMKALPGDKVTRLGAHRQNWVSSDALDISAASRVSQETNIRNHDRNDQSIRRDDYAGNRVQVAMSRFLAAQSRHFQEIVEKEENQDIKVGELRAKEKSPLDRLNALLRRGAFDFSLLFGKDETILAKREDHQFGFSRLSDGERNAVFMALDVLSLPDETVIIIDEPERHLHRSIIIPLLQAMFDERPTCFFIVATHEIALPTEARGETLIMRQCLWDGDKIKGWDADILKPDASLPEDLRTAILGSRKRVLFVEGTNESLDRPIYAVLLPKLTVLPKGTSKAVKDAVSGLRSTLDQHHTEAFGIVDGDDLNEEAIKKLEAGSVFALPMSAIEGLYYGRLGIQAVTKKLGRDRNIDPAALAEEAIDAALKALSQADIQKHLVAVRVERRVRNSIQSQFPDSDALMAAGETGTLTYAIPLKEETENLSKLISSKKLDDIASQYPIKRSSVTQAVSTALKTRERAEYEKIFLQALAEDAELRTSVLKEIGPVAKLA
jgi:ABC-type cobalamin/Fe3+-siderophores transport system ATPase subunit